MARNFTPNTYDVADSCVHADTSGAPDDQLEAEFDRWLAEHDREVAAKALREAADDMDAEYEARTARVGAYGQMKIRAALRMGAGMVRGFAARIWEGKVP